MPKKMMAALAILLLTALVLVFNTKGADISVHLVFTTVTAIKSIVFLGFIAVGVAIGLLLK